MGASVMSYFQSCQVVIRNDSEILNVQCGNVDSKPPKLASRPAQLPLGLGAL